MYVCICIFSLSSHLSARVILRQVVNIRLLRQRTRITPINPCLPATRLCGPSFYPSHSQTSSSSCVFDTCPCAYESSVPFSFCKSCRLHGQNFLSGVRWRGTIDSPQSEYDVNIPTYLHRYMHVLCIHMS